MRIRKRDTFILLLETGEPIDEAVRAQLREYLRGFAQFIQAGAFGLLG